MGCVFFFFLFFFALDCNWRGCFCNLLTSNYHWWVSRGISERQTSWPNHSWCQLFVLNGLNKGESLQRVISHSWDQLLGSDLLYELNVTLFGADRQKSEPLHLTPRRVRLPSYYLPSPPCCPSLLCAAFIQTPPPLSPQTLCLLISYNCPPMLDQRVACCNQLCEQHHKWGWKVWGWGGGWRERGKEAVCMSTLRERQRGSREVCVCVMGGWKMGEMVCIRRGGGGGGGGGGV